MPLTRGRGERPAGDEPAGSVARDDRSVLDPVQHANREFGAGALDPGLLPDGQLTSREGGGCRPLGILADVPPSARYPPAMLTRAS
jgi:hypothetical protein